MKDSLLRQRDLLCGFRSGDCYDVTEQIMTPDGELIEKYVREGSEPAFAELVRRHVDLVYGTALRLVAGEVPMAEDVAQSVFIDLARKARALRGRSSLTGWLHTATRFAAIEAIRREQRRRAREGKAVVMADQTTDAQVDWEKLWPVLDGAVGGLKDSDRTAVLLRFFEGKSLREVGQALGLAENTARMRLDRALDRLRTALARKGIRSTVSALSAALSSSPISAAPASLISTVTSSALAAGAAGGVGGLGGTLLTVTMANLKLGITGAVLIVGLGTTLLIQQRSLHALRLENLNLQTEAAKADERKSIQDRLAEQQVSAEVLNRLRKDNEELLRLRGQVGVLRQQLAQNQTAGGAQRTSQDSPRAERDSSSPPDPTERLARAREWSRAVLRFAEENQGRLPQKLADAREYLPVGTNLDSSLAEFETVLVPGDMTDAPKPGETIIIRQAEPDVLSDGRFSKVYAFADGHTQIRYSVSNDFAVYEQTWPGISKGLRRQSVVNSFEAKRDDK